MANEQYHLQFFGPLKNEYVDWPAGAVSVYRITGDEIASRILFEDQADKSSRLLARHPWCGYIGTFNSLGEASAAIEADRECRQ